jgi:hypothetical protein
MGGSIRVLSLDVSKDLTAPSSWILPIVQNSRELTQLSGNRIRFRRMVSSVMLRRVALLRTDVSEELSASFIRMTQSVN